MNNRKQKDTKRKTLKGVVIKTASKDTATIAVTRYIKHPKYKKFVKKVKKYLVHDEGNKTEVGSNVVIVSTAPISKRKSFKIVQDISSNI